MSVTTRLALTAAMLSAGFAGAAKAAESPLGVWYDDTGRGAVEIVECGKGKLCGKLVWLQDAKNSKACGMAIIGDVVEAGDSWDGGWIYSPEKDDKFDVELTPAGNGKLKVLGYAGTKLFSREMTWTRAPADLKRCDQQVEAKAAPVPALPAAKGIETATTQSPPVTSATPPPKSGGAQMAAVPQVAVKPIDTPKTAEQAKAGAEAWASEPDRNGVKTAQADVPSEAGDKQAAVEPAAKPRVKTASHKRKMCRVDAPFVTVEFPCDDDD